MARRRRRLRPRALALCLALGAALALSSVACGSSAATTTVVPRAPTATPWPTPTPLPPQRELLADGGLGVIEVAFNRIVDEHVTPVDEAALLSAAWAGIETVARTGELEIAPLPPLSGDRARDLDVFRAAWRDLPLEMRAFEGTRWTAIDSLARSINDCHTYFLGPSLAGDDGEFEDRTLDGYGMTLTGRPAVVAGVETNPYSPAAVSGILPGDTILSVDGEDATAKGPLDVLLLLDSREANTNVDIVVRRPGQPGETTITINLSPYTPKNLQVQILQGGVGYIRIHHWVDKKLTQQLRDALVRFNKDNVKMWIIDLRGNAGGFVTTGPMSLFLPEGVVIRARGRDGAVTDESATGGTLPVPKPLAVLVDDASASMSEMFALALQEHDAAHLVGTNTAGCIGRTFISNIGDGSGLAVTRDLMLGPVTSADLNGLGVTPDEIVERTVDDIVAGRDPQLEAAISHLTAELVDSE